MDDKVTVAFLLLQYTYYCQSLESAFLWNKCEKQFTDIVKFEERIHHLRHQVCLLDRMCLIFCQLCRIQIIQQFSNLTASSSVSQAKRLCLDTVGDRESSDPGVDRSPGIEQICINVSRWTSWDI